MARRTGAFDQRGDAIVERRRLERAQGVGNRAVRPAVAAGPCVDDLAAAEGHHRRILPDDEAIAGQRERRLLEVHLGECGRAGLEHIPSEQHDVAHDFRRADMETHPLAADDRRRRRRQELELDVERRRGFEDARRDQDHTALDLVELDALQVQRRPLAGSRLVHAAAVHLDAAHPCAPLRGQHLDLVVFPDSSGDQRPRHDRAEAFHREAAVDREAEDLRRVARRDLAGQAAQLRLQWLDAFAGEGADAEEWRVLQERALQVLPDLHFGEIDDVALGRVDFRQHRQAALHAQQRADVEMFAGLRHHRFVRGDDQHDGVDAADARQHVLDEPLVARHVDEADRRLVVQAEAGKADVDGDAAFLFFLQAVGVDAGQRLHQRRFAMVDVSGGADHDVSHSPHSGRIDVR